MPTGHAPSTFNRRVKPAFLLPHDLSFPVGLASLPALSPRRCKQGWSNARGDGLRGEGSCGFYATLGLTNHDRDPVSNSIRGNEAQAPCEHQSLLERP